MKQTDEKGNPLTYWGGLEEQTKCYCGHTTTCDCIPEEEPKQETHEEVAQKYAELSYYGDEVEVFVRGAKWQAERSYSEEDMMFAYEQGARLALLSQSHLALHKGEFPNPEEWFNQHKEENKI